ncbi:MAG: hypothetical protein FWG61_09230 [Firmicutes bacterium]|nr:hypothetical protein [Bacillota bacterium]
MLEQETRIKKQLEKQGYILCKTKMQQVIDSVGSYMIVDAATLAIVAGPRFDLTWDDVMDYIVCKQQCFDYAFLR